MIDNKIIPSHIIRLYIWDIVQNRTTMETINGYVPIISIEDEPIIADARKPYIIYGYSEQESTRIEQIRRGAFVARIIAPDFGQLTQIINTIAAAFESTDIATEGLNTFASIYPDNRLVGIRFTKAKLGYLEGGEPPESEGGPVEGIVNISYEYISSLEIPVPASVKNSGLWL